MIEKRYLGDGLYASFDGYHVVLSAENGTYATDTVYLDDTVLVNFERYVADLKKAIKEFREQSSE